jgi:rare lipoprotein A
VVKINDRGPFHPNRIIDLSYAAAARLEMHEQGTAVVEVEALDPGAATPPNQAAGSVAPQPSLWLQVGAFGSRDNAERLRQRLERTLTRSIRVQDGSAGGQPVYRVQVGPLETVASSDQVNLQLSELGFSGLRLVVD